MAAASKKSEARVHIRRFSGVVGEDGQVAVGADSAVLAEALALGLRPVGEATSRVIDEDGKKVVVWSVPVEENC